MRAYPDYVQPKEDWLRGFLSRILYGLLLAAIAILLVCWFLPLVREQQKQQRALLALKEQVEQERALYNKQTKKANLLRSDSGYIELLARDKLDLMKPGETIFRMEAPSPSKPQQ